MGVSNDKQNILQRALSYGRRAVARSIASDPQVAKALSTTSPQLARIFATYYGYDDEKLTDPYSQIATVYACNRVISSNISQVPYRLYPRGSDQPTESGPLYDLYHSPNPYMTGRQMWAAVATLLGIVGYAPVFKDPETVNNVPVALWPKHPKHTTTVRNGNEVFVGWNLMMQGNVLFFPRDEVIVPKYWNPNDEILGMSPIEALNLSLQSEWGAIRYNRQFFEQGQVPGAVFSTDQMLDQESFKQLKYELIDTRAGADKAHKAMLLHGGLKLAAERPSNRDLEFLKLREFTRDDVTMVYRVPKSEISLYEDTNYATAVSADLGFWKKTLIPIMRLIEDYFDIGLNNALGFEGKFDLDSIDALNSEVLQKAESAEKFVRMGVPFSVVNDRLGLGFPEFDGDSVPLYGSGIQPAGDTVQESSNVAETKAIPISGDPEPETVVEGYDVTKAMRTAKWKSLMNEVNPLMGRANREIKDWFFGIQQEILKAVTKSVDGQTVTKAEQLSDFEWIDRYFSDAAFRELIGPLLEDAIGLGGDSVRFFFGQIPNESIRMMVAERFEKVTGIVDTARETVLRSLRGALSQAIDSGATEEQRAQMIIDAVKSSMKINSNRARTIARTEMHSAYASGRAEAAKETEPSHKMWISSRDGNVRETECANHRQMDGQRVPFDQNYSNGLKHPLDPNGEACEVINCYLPGTTIRGDVILGLKTAYSGPAVHIVTKSGVTLAVTPNHPVFTANGLWKRAADISKGDTLFGYSGGVDGSLDVLGNVDNKKKSPALVEDAFEALRDYGSSMVVSANLHGDGEFAQSKIEVVGPARHLLSNVESKGPDGVGNLVLSETLKPISGLRSLAKPGVGVGVAGSSGPGGGALSFDKGSILLDSSPFDFLSFGSPPDVDATLSESAKQNYSSDAAFALQLESALSGNVLFDDVVEIRHFFTHTSIYDLQSIDGWIIADNIVCGNCRCVEVYDYENE